jgi:hypothetical protein
LAIRHDEIDDWLAKTAADETKRLSDFAVPKLAEVRYLSKELKTAFGQMASQSVESDTGNTALRKVVSGSKQSVGERFTRLIEKLEPPRSLEFSALSAYATVSYPLLQKEIHGMRKEIAYTGILLSGEIKGLGEHFGELEKVLSDLASEFSKSPVTGRLVTVRAQQQNLAELRERKRDLSDKTAANRSELLSIEDRILSTHARLNTEQASQTAKRLGELRLALEKHARTQFELESSLSAQLEPIDKPLRRLHQIVEAKTAPNDSLTLRPDMTMFLSTLMRSAPSAFKSDPKGALFKELLVELKQAIDSGVVTLKEKEKERAISAIYSLSEYDFFEHFFWKHNAAEAEKQKIERELKSSVYFLTIQGIEAELKRLEEKKALLAHEQAALSVALDKNRAETDRGIQVLETELSAMHGGAVKVLP